MFGGLSQAGALRTMESNPNMKQIRHLADYCLPQSTLFVAVFGFLVSGQLAFGGQLTVVPSELKFDDAFARRQLLVSSEGLDLTGLATYESSDASIVSVDASGYVTPKANGSGQITIRHAQGELKIPFSVTNYDRLRHIDFATEIVPLLSRYGCNSGGCHGKASGQNGFKLSLFGFDPEFDYQALVSEARGRRLMLAAPQNSLLLLKGTGRTPHGGGAKLNPNSEAYQVLLAWIKLGAPNSNADIPTLTKLEITPRERIMQPQLQQQLSVLAHYSDGSQRDVTRLTYYSSNLDVVAAVDAQGLVTTADLSGEATVMARFMGEVAVFRAIVPHGAPLAELPDFKPNGEIDRLSAEKWKKLGLKPSPVCDDATFIRRITVDLCGRLPTMEEAKAFLDNQTADKRTKLIDRLLESPDYPGYFATRWGVILRNSNLAGADQAAYAFHNWIRDSIARNRPYDEFVRGIVAASGEWQDAPAINWYWQSRDDQLHQVTADTGQLFLGIRLQCARCHHHPYERWGQEDYYGLSGFFTRLGRKSFGQPPPYYAASNVTTGERNPLTNKTPEPKYPNGEYAKFTSEQDPRHALVDWMTQPNNPYFAKAQVNRLWGHFLGRGLVHEVDDMRETNPPSNPELLNWLSQQFVEHKYDVKHIIRQIVTSQVYQLSSEPISDNRNDRQNFARYYARRLPAEVFHDALDQSCGTRTKFNNMSANARAVDLPHEGFGSYLLDTFDRPKRVTVCECERSTGATLAQVLLLANSDEIENKVADGKGRVAKMFEAKLPNPQIIQELFLASFSRYPTDAEIQATTRYLEQEGDLRKNVEDVLWTLLNSKEFMFNH